MFVHCTYINFSFPISLNIFQNSLCIVYNCVAFNVFDGVIEPTFQFQIKRKIWDFLSILALAFVKTLWGEEDYCFWINFWFPSLFFFLWVGFVTLSTLSLYLTVYSTLSLSTFLFLWILEIGVLDKNQGTSVPIKTPPQPQSFSCSPLLYISLLERKGKKRKKR